MPSLPARLAAVLTVAVALFVAVGCVAQPDPVEGVGALSTYGAGVGAGDEGDDGQADGDVGDDGPLVGADDSAPSAAPGKTLDTTTSVRATADVNLRTGAGSSYSVIAVVPSGTLLTVVDPTVKNGFLNVKFGGTSGWVYAIYLEAVSSGTVAGGGGGGGGAVTSLDGPASPANAFARASAAIGFSYYWGGGAWLPTGATSSTKGSCSGACPSCSHSGKYGADCSGLISKAWQYGEKALEVDSHPYSTATFNKPLSGKWSNVSRDSLRLGDALVYNNGSAGHIVLYEKGDAWGTPVVIECRGCSYGCVYNSRAFTSSYHGIRRSGF